MKNWLLILSVIANLILLGSFLKFDERVVWTDLASLHNESIEEKAREFLLLKIPELKGVEIKFIQMNAMHHKFNEPELYVSFIHANSFKPMVQNETLGSVPDYYGNKYYMEFVHVEFSLKGVPINVRLNEVLLGKEEKKSRESFLKTYNSF